MKEQNAATQQATPGIWIAPQFFNVLQYIYYGFMRHKVNMEWAFLVLKDSILSLLGETTGLICFVCMMHEGNVIP